MPPTPLSQDSLSTDVKQSSNPKAPKAKKTATKGRVDSPLTFTQALTITAGMAGLVGLLSGGFVRFSLAHSPNTRALSPLQTFPNLSDRSGEALQLDSETFEAPAASPTPFPEATSPERWQTPSESDSETNANDFDTFSAESFTDSPATAEPFLVEESTFMNGSESSDLTDSQDRVPETFDIFANRENRERTTDTDPLKALSNGPLLRQPVTEGGASNDAGARSPVEETDG
ncbi:MAG: hypothetical protein WA883_06330 [Phormidesmis sp.]